MVVMAVLAMEARAETEVDKWWKKQDCDGGNVIRVQ